MSSSSPAPQPQPKPTAPTTPGQQSPAHTMSTYYAMGVVVLGVLVLAGAYITWLEFQPAPELEPIDNTLSVEGKSQLLVESEVDGASAEEKTQSLESMEENIVGIAADQKVEELEGSP